MGYSKNVPKILPPDLDRELASHLVKLSERFYGLSSSKVKRLAYQFAVANHITVPSSWEIQGKAGKDWLRLFMQRNELAIRKPEPTSIARATAFNKETTQTFFDNLAKVLDKHKFQSAQQRWSRGHKARGQGQGQPFRGQTLSRPTTGMLEAKAKDQGHKRKCSPKKKVFTKIFQAISKKKERSSQKFFK